MRILGPAETLKGLLEHLEPSQIPTYYGGQLVVGDGGKECARFSSREVLELNDFVTRLNAGESMGPFPNAHGLPSASPRGQSLSLSVTTPLRGGARPGSSGSVVSPLTPEVAHDQWSVGTGVTGRP